MDNLDAVVREDSGIFYGQKIKNSKETKKFCYFTKNN